MMPALAPEIAAFSSMQDTLEAEHMGEWAVFHDQKLVSLYDSFEQAASEAVRQFGRGPYLIRQIGAPPVVLPASVMYHPDYGVDEMRVRQR